MKVVKKRYVYLVLSIFLILCTILLCIHNSTKHINLDKVSLKMNNIVEKNMFAIMVSKNGGGYEETNVFPTVGSLNTELSGCIDANGKKIKSTLTFIGGIVNAEVDSTAYCYLYIDIVSDVEPPTNNKILINNNDIYTNSTNVTLTLSSTGASQMCISNTTNCSNWEAYNTNKSWVLASGDGVKTVYVWFKDEYNNVSEYVVDTICTNNTELGTCLKSAKTSGFNSNLEGGLYRYQGTTNVNNYICFGTTTKSTCTGNTDAYMYRIIGVDSSGQVQLIKKEALNSTMAWGSDSSIDTPWSNSILYTNINGSSFYTNTTYVPTSWQNKIVMVSWKYGATASNFGGNGIDTYNIENAFTTSINAKIGLMHLYDYKLSYQSEGYDCGTICKSSWMHLSNNDTAAPSTREWTMTAANLSASRDSWRIEDDGSYSNYPITLSYSVRPVFYLTTDVLYSSGIGTTTDPFILS